MGQGVVEIQPRELQFTCFLVMQFSSAPIGQIRLTRISHYLLQYGYQLPIIYEHSWSEASKRSFAGQLHTQRCFTSSTTSLGLRNKVKGSRRGLRALQVVCQDFPRPPLENTINYLEAGQLSSSF
ncbi:hypothetical protein ACQJBY_062513 [Aegilops geniculata]